jgi:hypothetical protein
MYADDVTGLVSSPEHMTQLIQHIELFCELFGMKVNASKTFVVIFNNPRMSRIKHVDLVKDFHWRINGHDIAIKGDAKFLGCTFHGSKGCLAAPDALAIKGRKAAHAMLVSMRSHCINQSAFLCRMFDQLVEPVLSYGCHVWGPDVFHQHLQLSTILKRNNNPIEAVHIDFLRLVGGLPPSSPLWILFWEFDRVPLHFRWITLCARFWHKVLHSTSVDMNVLLRQAMKDNIELALQRAQHCWVFKFLTSMVSIGTISQEALDACNTLEQIIALPITEDSVRSCLGVYWKALGSQIIGDPPKPRDAHDGTPITYARYKEWVESGKSPMHLSAFLPTHLKHNLIRLRSTGFPLLAFSNQLRKGKIPRSQRLCKACVLKGVNCVEDDMHFLIECPAYSIIRSQYATIFHDEATPASIYNYSNQFLLGKAIKSMLLQRSTA